MVTFQRTTMDFSDCLPKDTLWSSKTISGLTNIVIFHDRQKREEDRDNQLMPFTSLKFQSLLNPTSYLDIIFLDIEYYIGKFLELIIRMTFLNENSLFKNRRIGTWSSQLDIAMSQLDITVFTRLKNKVKMTSYDADDVKRSMFFDKNEFILLYSLLRRVFSRRNTTLKNILSTTD